MRNVDLLVWKMNIYHKTIYPPFFLLLPLLLSFLFLSLPNIWNFAMNEWRLNARLIAATAAERRKSGGRHTYKDWCGWDLWFFFVIACVSNRSSIMWCHRSRVCVCVSSQTPLLFERIRLLLGKCVRQMRPKWMKIFTDFHASQSWLRIQWLSIALQIYYFIVRRGVFCVRQNECLNSNLLAIVIGMARARSDIFLDLFSLTFTGCWLTFDLMDDHMTATMR